jgi:hypothetical protein
MSREWDSDWDVPRDIGFQPMLAISTTKESCQPHLNKLAARGIDRIPYICRDRERRDWVSSMLRRSKCEDRLHGLEAHVTGAGNRVRNFV